jgi:hypothetical protein
MRKSLTRLSVFNQTRNNALRAQYAPDLFMFLPPVVDTSHNTRLLSSSEADLAVRYHTSFLWGPTSHRVVHANAG